jgi:hypothetical protein
VPSKDNFQRLIPVCDTNRRLQPIAFSTETYGRFFLPQFLQLPPSLICGRQPATYTPDHLSNQLLYRYDFITAPTCRSTGGGRARPRDRQGPPGGPGGEQLPRRAQHSTKSYKLIPKFFPRLIFHVSLQHTRCCASQWSPAKTVLKKPKNYIRANSTKVFNSVWQRDICAVDACPGNHGLEDRHRGAFGRWWCSTLWSDGGE